MKIKLPNSRLPKVFKILALVVVIGILVAFLVLDKEKITALQERVSQLLITETKLKKQLEDVDKQLVDLKGQDQYKVNQDLKKEVDNIQKTYNQAVISYEKIIEFDDKNKRKNEIEKNFAKSLKYLSDKNYASASAVLADIDKTIKEETDKAVASFKIPENVKESNTPPSSGHSKQKVSTEIGDYLVDIVTADLNSTRVIIDTASDNDCDNDCPVLNLADYTSRSGAFAGINGSYFCPASYPSCAGKTNSYDTLLMNKNKKYFNSDNNVYSSVPAVIFSGNSARFVGRSQDWGRDTGVDAVIANHPLLLSGGNITVGGTGDPKQGSKGSRSFVGSTGSTAYIGVVHNATVTEMAIVLKQLGVQSALNLDSGGSTALWAGGYKVGPGRQIPNALLFVRK